ncbi:toll-interleukin receptor [Nostoc linckia NIES-25]|nr:toll-interleukin receptor [Nostoc linckia NIES-25]
MMEAEIATAYLLAKEQGGHPLMRVPLDYGEAFQYPLSVYLNGIN